jgi:hypothetical protein
LPTLKGVYSVSHELVGGALVAIDFPLRSDTGLLIFCIGSIHQFEATLSDNALLRFKLLNERQLLACWLASC